MSVSVEVNYWAEGPTDRAAARKLIRLVGAVPGADYSQRRGASPGKDYLDRRLKAFNAAALYTSWLVLRDSDGECEVEIVRRLLPSINRGMRLRIVVPALESWLIADREAFATHLGVRPTALPPNPEKYDRLKELIVRAAGDSRKRNVKSDLVPKSDSGGRVGSGYTQQLIDFINSSWNPSRAAHASPSLCRAIKRLQELVDQCKR